MTACHARPVAEVASPTTGFAVAVARKDAFAAEIGPACAAASNRVPMGVTVDAVLSDPYWAKSALMLAVVAHVAVGAASSDPPALEEVAESVPASSLALGIPASVVSPPRSVPTDSAFPASS